MKKPEDNIPLFKVYMDKEVSKPLNDVLTSGFIGQGPVVEGIGIGIGICF